MTKKLTKANALAVVVPAEETVEIKFDFQRVDLFDFFDLMELSAAKESGKEVAASDTMKFIHMLRSAYVSSSRPLTVADFNATIEAFWKSAEVFKSPNA